MKRLFGIGTGILLAALVAATPASAVPGVMGYQGKLNTSAGVPVGQGLQAGADVDMTFTRSGAGDRRFDESEAPSKGLRDRRFW